MPNHNSLPHRSPSEAGPVVQYLRQLAANGDPVMLAKAKEAAKAVLTVLSTPDGAMVLELLEKSTTDYFLPPTSDVRALDALNAQRFIALDLRRIMSDETDKLLSISHDTERSGRRRVSGTG